MRDLRELFPEDDFGFRLTLKRGAPADFFKPGRDSAAVLAERRKWLAESPHDYAILPESAQPAWAEFCGLAGEWIGQPVPSDPVRGGGLLEPDVVVMTRDESGIFRLRGGVVVFPSHWALADKLEQTLLEVHGVVPGLNTAIGSAIDRYLDRLRPGFAAERSNWGLAATDAMNLHPATHPVRLVQGMSVDDIWLRIEDQSLSLLPKSDAILFGIRIESIRLTEVLADSEIRRRFHRALKTMPSVVAEYKGITTVMPELLRISAF